MAAQEVKDGLEAWWEEDAARINAFAEKARAFAVKIPPKDESRAFCPGASPPDNSCSPSNKGSGAKTSGPVPQATQAARKSIEKTGGFSVHPITGASPTSGYMVSVVPEAETILESFEQVTEEAIAGFYDGNKSLFEADPDLHLGGWIDRETGKIYLDLSRRFDDIDEAIDAAAATNQLAIWDLNESNEIRKEDYDARRTKGRPKARSIRLSSRHLRQRGRRRPSRVRKEGNGRQARGGEGQAVLSGIRAFCPGASPPDNSCSPSNKGSGGPRGPKAIEPPAPDMTPDFVADPRGAASGHSKAQRYEFLDQAAKWCLDRGITLDQKDDMNGPPTVYAVQAAMRGVEELERLGWEVPELISLEDVPGNPLAAFNVGTGEISIDSDFDSNRVAQGVAEGFLAGVKGQEQGGALVHEVSHRDHKQALTDVFKGSRDPEEAAINRMVAWVGNPDILGPTTDPWEPSARLDKSAKKSGRILDSAQAKGVAAQVSMYATTTPLEFVAETRTGIALGLKYPKTVLDLYRDYGGPELPARKPARKKKAA